MQRSKSLFGFMMLMLAAFLMVAGCNPPKGKKGAGGHGHVHGEGPHGGLVVELGADEYHAEFVVDHDKKEATVYILDEEGKEPVAVNTDSVKLHITNEAPPLAIPLKADPQPNDPAGMSSKFVGTHDKIGVVMDFKGTIDVEINGKPYSGSFEEKDH